MLLTQNDIALKLALLAALWSAIIGFILVGRYRRQVERSREELAYEQRLHRSQLRQAQANAQAEQAKARTEYQLRDADMAILADIRAGLDELKAQLEELSGHSFEYEPAALRAEAWRLRELEAEAHAVGGEHFEKAGHASGAPSVDAVEGRLGASDVHGQYPRSISPELARLLEDEDSAAAAPLTPSDEGWAVTTEASGSDAYTGSHRGGDSSELASWLYAAHDDPEPEPDPEPEEEPQGRHSGARARRREQNRDQDRDQDREQDSGRHGGRRRRQADQDRDEAAGYGHHASPEEPAAEIPSWRADDTAEMGVRDIARGEAASPRSGEGRRGRRRADENARSVSVADLVAGSERRRR